MKRNLSPSIRLLLILKLLLGLCWLNKTYSQTTIIADCLTQKADLSLISASNIPSNSIVSWHTSNVVSSGNRINDVTALSVGTYYAAFYHTVDDCYGSGIAEVVVEKRNCLITTVDCNSGTIDLATIGVSNLPSGTSLSWHTSELPTNSNKINNVSALGPNTYYAAFYDASFGCYSSEVTPVKVNTALCASYECPDTSVNLTTEFSASSIPSGLSISWHTSFPVSTSNKIVDPTKAASGNYFASYYDAVADCYAGEGYAATEIIVETLICDSDGDGETDLTDIDADNDGILDSEELGGLDPYGDEDGDGIKNWVDTNDDGNGGDGSSTSYIDEDGNGVPDLYDTDGDGIANHLDLDSDNDGIADIIEAGGIDADNDGRADDNTDTDGDGYANTFDSNNGGTALAVPDTDGDGIANYLDLDSDNDGITDNVEGQTTDDFKVPLGTDTDGDGWDDRYDSDNGGTAIVLSNIDNDSEADYLDQDSDGDGTPDFIEGFDDDEDSDALNDLILRATNYESAAANPLHYVNSDDSDDDGIPNWLEDDDMDGVVNFLDPDNTLYVDTDGDGLVNLYDTDNKGVASILPDTDADGEYDFRDTDAPVGGLPITLIDFTAVKVSEMVQLNWSTASEINNDYFTIERSIDGSLFESLLTEAGAGNSNSRRDYMRFDSNPHEGYNYYRLKQTDFDGTTEVFDIKVVFFEGSKSDIKVFPNPSNGSQLFLELNNQVIGECIIKIYSSTSQLIHSKTIQLPVEERIDNINILENTPLQTGVYYLSIQSNQFQYSTKFLVK